MLPLLYLLQDSSFFSLKISPPTLKNEFAIDQRDYQRPRSKWEAAQVNFEYWCSEGAVQPRVRSRGTKLHRAVTTRGTLKCTKGGKERKPGESTGSGLAV